MLTEKIKSPTEKSVKRGCCWFPTNRFGGSVHQKHFELCFLSRTGSSIFGANDCLDIGIDVGSPVSLDYFEKALSTPIVKVHGNYRDSNRLNSRPGPTLRPIRDEQPHTAKNDETFKGWRTKRFWFVHRPVCYSEGVDEGRVSGIGSTSGSGSGSISGPGSGLISGPGSGSDSGVGVGSISGAIGGSVWGTGVRAISVLGSRTFCVIAMFILLLGSSSILLKGLIVVR